MEKVRRDRQTRDPRQPEPEVASGRRPEAVRVELLGGFRVTVGSRVVPDDAWRLRKAAGLIKLLALARDHRLHREQAMDVLWPDLGPMAAANNVHRTLYAARRTLEPRVPAAGSRHLRLGGEQLELCPGGSLTVDAEVFEEAAARARRLLDPAAYRAAVDLYAGELLPADRYEPVKSRPLRFEVRPANTEEGGTHHSSKPTKRLLKANREKGAESMNETKANARVGHKAPALWFLGGVVLVAVTLATLALAAPAQSAGLAKTTLTIRADGLDLSGKVKSPRSSCLGNRTVKVYKQAGSEQKPATDSVIGSDTSQRQGNVGEWSTGNSGISGKVYARTGKTAGCKGDSSETIRARR